jgi:hypothetical protein
MKLILDYYLTNNLDFLINEFSLDLKNFYPSTKIEFKSENFIIENLNKDFSSEKDSLLKSESLELEKPNPQSPIPNPQKLLKLEPIKTTQKF